MTEVAIASHPSDLPLWSMTYAMKINIMLTAFRSTVQFVDLQVVIPT